MSRVLHQPSPREPLASDPLVRLREPPPLRPTWRRWHLGRKAMSGLGQKAAARRRVRTRAAAAAMARPERKGRVGARDAADRKRVTTSGAATRWKAQAQGITQGCPNTGECEPDWLPREAAQVGEARLRCLHKNASANMPHRYEGTRMRVPWPPETEERGRMGGACGGIERRRNLGLPDHINLNIQSGGTTEEMATHLEPYSCCPTLPSRSRSAFILKPIERAR